MPPPPHGTAELCGREWVSKRAESHLGGGSVNCADKLSTCSGQIDASAKSGTPTGTIVTGVWRPSVMRRTCSETK